MSGSGVGWRVLTAPAGVCVEGEAISCCNRPLAATMLVMFKASQLVWREGCRPTSAHCEALPAFRLMHWGQTGVNSAQIFYNKLPDGDLLIAFELHLTRTNAFHCASHTALLTEDAAQRLVCVCGGGGSPGDPSTLGKCRCGWPHTQTHPNYPEACIPYTYTIKPFHLLQWSSNRLLVYLS